MRFPCVPVGFWYGPGVPSGSRRGAGVVLVVPGAAQHPALPAAPTMRLYSLSVLYKGETRVQLLKAASDVSTFNFFQRSR